MSALEELIRRSQSGDKEAQEQLAKVLFPVSLWCHICSRVGGRSLCQEEEKHRELEIFAHIPLIGVKDPGLKSLI